MIINVILPVMLIMAAGYLFGRFTNVDQAPISKFSMVVLSPALIFSFLVRTNLSAVSLIQILVATVLFTIFLAAITFVVMKITKNKMLLNPALLSTLFPNSGNVGLPVLLFAYGDEGFSIGVVIVVIHFVLIYSLGVYFASMEGGNWKKGLKNVTKLPTTYATILSLIVIIFKIDVPDFLYDPIKLVGDAMVPVVLLILGIQLSKTKISSAEGLEKGKNVSSLISISVIKLLISPLLIIAIVIVGQFDPLIAKVLILQSSMPTAVLMTMIATEYKAKPELVASATFVTTLLSFFSITGLLYLLNYLY
ncbi:AEC family transporter [Neobacillus mesonae]|uniref:AEC family transporter n=1 Tax=Neobacillus mesonae TaxID=1193713 RepID=UPI00203EE8DD|nr:AEC family transporter [Neobacillus mesonae]MCM3566942.1 AEC family transporter [Neobacillus mesonae]